MTMCCSSTGCTVSSSLFGVCRAPFPGPCRLRLSAFCQGYLCIAYMAGYCVLPVDVRFGAQVLTNQVLRQLGSHMVSYGDLARVGCPLNQIIIHSCPYCNATVFGVGCQVAH